IQVYLGEIVLVSERDGPMVLLDTGTGHEAWHEPGVQPPDLTHRVPHVLGASVEQDLLADRSHDGLPSSGGHPRQRAVSLSWRILRSPLAARRNLPGETPAARSNVRTKLERSPKPTSNATSVIDRLPSASSRAARRSRARTRY